MDGKAYTGIRASLVCHCGCGLLSADDAFVAKLEALEAAYGQKLRISSGYRCPKHNAAVGGAKKSYHMRGMAADILVSSRQDRDRLEDLARQEGFTGFGKANSFLHVDTGDPRKPWTYGGAV